MLTSLFTYVTEKYTSWLTGIMSILPKESTFTLPSSFFISLSIRLQRVEMARAPTRATPTDRTHVSHEKALQSNRSVVTRAREALQGTSEADSHTNEAEADEQHTEHDVPRTKVLQAVLNRHPEQRRCNE